MSLSPRAAIAVLVLSGAASAAHAKGAPAGEATPLSFQEMLEPSPGALEPTAKLLALRGRRVRLVGYMARMESPPRGAFYLAPHPVFCDEAGGGTADLPPEAVRVVVRSAAGQVVPHVPRALELTGTLELGPEADEDGRVSSIRLVLDRAGNPRHPRPKSPAPTRRSQKESP